MDSLTTRQNVIPAMTNLHIDRVREAEAKLATLPQVPVVTSHLIHAGIYARTMTLPAGVVITGALIKRATTLIVSGDAVAHIGDDNIELRGYNVIPASANRKQAFITESEVHLTMLFATSAKSVAEVEAEFTDETDLLCSRLEHSTNHVTITGE